MSGEVVFLEAYRRAIWRGSREQPVWDRADTARCWRKLRFDRADRWLSEQRRPPHERGEAE